MEFKDGGRGYVYAKIDYVSIHVYLSKIKYAYDSSLRENLHVGG